MNIPKDANLPPQGKRKAWTRSNWGSGRYGFWYVIDDKGKVITSHPDIYRMARAANKEVKSG